MVGILNTKASDSSEIGSDFRKYLSYLNNTRFEYLQEVTCKIIRCASENNLSSYQKYCLLFMTNFILGMLQRDFFKI